MTKKDFELIARVIADNGGRCGEPAARSIAEGFADELRLTNPRFDRARFLKACGVED